MDRALLNLSVVALSVPLTQKEVFDYPIK
jgi:hypothetical protein